MRRRTHRSLWIAIALLAAVTVVLLLRQKAPPEAARLLPECDAIAYVKLSTLRTLGHFDTGNVPHSPDLQRFIDATGIDWERDLDAAAIALHRVPVPHQAGAKGPSAEVFASYVFIGKFDGQRLAKYLSSIASGHESYAGHEIYTLIIDGQPLRIAQAGYDTIAASNMPTAEQIHSMLDRHRASGLWTPGSSLLAARYDEVPLLSQAWAIGHIGLPFAENGHIALMGLELPLSEDTDLVASLRYSGSVHLRVEEIAPTEDNAKRTVETMTTVLNLLRGIQDGQAATTPGAKAMRSVVDSIGIEQHKDRAILNAAASTDEIRALASAANTPPPEPPPPATPAPPAPSKH